MQAGIRAVDAGLLTRDAFAEWPESTSPVWLIAAGKAAITMASAAVDVLGDRLQGGLVVSPGGLPGAPLAGVVGQHPQPGPGSEEGGRRALAIAEAIPPDAELVVLISGGASSLFAVPADGLTLDDKRAATAVLLRSGADISALNTVRKHLSKIKGGRLAAAVFGLCTDARGGRAVLINKIHRVRPLYPHGVFHSLAGGDPGRCSPVSTLSGVSFRTGDPPGENVRIHKLST